MQLEINGARNILSDQTLRKNSVRERGRRGGRCGRALWASIRHSLVLIKLGHNRSFLGLGGRLLRFWYGDENPFRLPRERIPERAI